MDRETKKGIWKVRLIAFAASLVMLAAAMGITLWQYEKFTAAYMPFNLTRMIIVNCVGAAVMYLIISYYLKKNLK